MKDLEESINAFGTSRMCQKFRQLCRWSLIRLGNTWGCKCLTYRFDGRDGIFFISLSWNWKYQLFQLLPDIFRGCVSGVVTPSISIGRHISISGKLSFGFHCHRANYDDCKWSSTLWSHLLVGILLSSCWVVWKHWTCLSDICCPGHVGDVGFHRFHLWIWWYMISADSFPFWWLTEYLNFHPKPPIVKSYMYML